jgi:hypothetical protein
MEHSNDWSARLRKQLEVNLDRTSREVTECEWVFDPAIVDVIVDGNSVFVTVIRAFEPDHPERTGPRFERRFSVTDDVEDPAREIGQFIKTLG